MCVWAFNPINKVNAVYQETKHRRKVPGGLKVIIYKITNKINGKVYIGRTKRTLEVRWKAHCHDANSRTKCYKLQRAIKEFGAANFTVEQIDVADSLDEANAKEVYWIKFYNSMEDGYNTSPGGKAGGSRKKVKSVEDGLVFDTMKDAAKHYGVAVSLISYVANKPHLKGAGQHWVTL